MIGCGKFAGYHARTLAEREDCQVVACVDVDEKTAAAFIAEHLAEMEQPPVIATDIATTFAKTKPDAVVIATPHTLHFEQINLALDAGCHVFVEKPMVTRVDQAKKLEARIASMSPQLVFVVGYNTLCTSELDYLRRVIHAPHSDIGLGPLRKVNGWLSQNWLNWCRGSWRVQPEWSGGGFAFDTGAHVLASLCFAVDQPVAEVSASIDCCGEKVDVSSSIHVRFTNEVTADLTFNGDCASEGCRMTFLFDGGRIEIDGWYGSWMEVHNAWGKVKYPKVNTDLPSNSALERFIQGVQGIETVESGVRLGAIQAALMAGVYESAASGKPVSPVG